MKTTVEIAYHDSQGPVYVMGIPDEMMRQLDLHADDWVEVTLERTGDDVTATVKKTQPTSGGEGGE